MKKAESLSSLLPQYVFSAIISLSLSLFADLWPFKRRPSFLFLLLLRHPFPFLPSPPFPVNGNGIVTIFLLPSFLPFPLCPPPPSSLTPHQRRTLNAPPVPYRYCPPEKGRGKEGGGGGMAFPDSPSPRSPKQCFCERSSRNAR